MPSKLSNEEKRKLSNLRQNAVRWAWREEKNRVESGYGTRKWNNSEKEELLETGTVTGYDGHHMKSVSKYPEYAGEYRNIQFLTEEEHFQGAHKGNFHNVTNGYYDPQTKTMHEFRDDELPDIPVFDLSNGENNISSNQLNSAKTEYLNQNAEILDKSNEVSEELDDIRNDYTNTYFSCEGNNDALSSNEQREQNGIGR